MVLGELYVPKGKAYETAKKVLGVEPMACNPSYGCKNMCSYCYIPWIKKGRMRFPKVSPPILINNQLVSGIQPKGVFLSFATDPFLEINRQNSNEIIKILRERNVRVATLSKVGVADINYLWGVKTGMTIISDSDEFRKIYEPNTLSIKKRIAILKEIHEGGGYTWISLEPYPTPEIWKQELEHFLDKISFVDFIIFGKWNYDRRTSCSKARMFYISIAKKFQDCCKAYGIRHWIKDDTKDFLNRKR